MQVDQRAFGKAIEVAHIDGVELLVPDAVAESALGNLAEKRHLAALEDRARQLGAGGGVLPLRAPATGFAMAGPDAAANPLLQLALVDAMRKC